MKRGKLVILVGIDGSGKSTLLSYLEGKGYFTSHWRKLRRFPLARRLNFENPGETVQSLSGQERLDFIWEYINSEWECLIKPTLEIGRNVISDGFFIRFFAKEKIYNRLAINELLGRSPLTGNEFVIMVDVSPQLAFRRKVISNISLYECFKTLEDFVYFQTLQRKVLLKCVQKFPHVVVKGALPKGKLAAKVLGILSENKIKPG